MLIDSISLSGHAAIPLSTQAGCSVVAIHKLHLVYTDTES